MEERINEGTCRFCGQIVTGARGLKIYVWRRTNLLAMIARRI